MKVAAVLFVLVIFFCSFYQAKSLAGKWEYAGDIFNGKKEAAPTEYTLLNNDTCLETQTFCSQPSKLLNIAVHYHYAISNDTLILHGILPDGESTTEYWKKVK